MATFLIRYSNVSIAREKGLPQQGSTIEIVTMADLDAFMTQTGSGVVVSPSWQDAGAPWWVSDFSEPPDADDVEFHYRVEALPEGWERMRWIEVYNGYRE